MLDLRILNGLVISDGVAENKDVGIEGDSIVEVGPPGSLGRAAEEVDAAGLYVLPGAVDVHFHCRAPGHPERGDFATETRAAVAGGVTTVFEMPISERACSTPEVFEQRRELAARQCYVDFALYAGAAVRNRAHALTMQECGAIAFKLFTNAPSPEREKEFAGLWAIDEDRIYDALAAISHTGLVCAVHAENDALLRAFARRSVLNGVPLRPPIVEATAIAVVGALAASTKTRIHVAHVTSQAALDALRGARAMGASVTGETCPQYLVFDENAIEKFGAFAKVAPPLRAPEDGSALWDGLRDGTIEIVASDHAPFRPEEKTGVSYAMAPQGMPTVETMVPILLDAALRGLLPIELAVDLITSAPARRFGLHPRKGSVRPGAAADISLFSPKGERKLTVRSLVSKAAGCGVLYEGMVLRGRLTRTIVGGRTVFLEGFVFDPPAGHFVRPGEARAEGLPEDGERGYERSTKIGADHKSDARRYGRR
jgi:dihydroorotase (multifunctional complex type)